MSIPLSDRLNTLYTHAITLDDEAIRSLLSKTAEDISRAVINPRKVIKGRYGKVDG